MFTFFSYLSTFNVKLLLLLFGSFYSLIHHKNVFPPFVFFSLLLLEKQLLLIFYTLRTRFSLNLSSINYCWYYFVWNISKIYLLFKFIPICLSFSLKPCIITPSLLLLFHCSSFSSEHTCTLDIPCYSCFLLGKHHWFFLHFYSIAFYHRRSDRKEGRTICSYSAPGSQFV